MNGGTFQILQPSGLFAADGRVEIASGTKVEVDLADVIALRSTPEYVASRTSVTFRDVMSPGITVVATQDGQPVVIHRYVRP